MIDQNDLIDLIDFYTFLNKEEFIELLSKYHHCTGKDLILIKKNHKELFKQSVYDIFYSYNISKYCKRFIYDIFISKYIVRLEIMTK
tara:strand:- start:457 stop:717 length:261 start_codon:yes stop_codon:yes gene_type:complete